MLRPSYTELMDIINQSAETDNKITSRYSIVIAAAKRARQLIDGAQWNAAGADKALSVAIEELLQGKIKIDPEGLAETQDWYGQARHRPAGRQPHQAVSNVSISADAVISSKDLDDDIMYEDELFDDEIAGEGAGKKRYDFQDDDYGEEAFAAPADDLYDEFDYEEDTVKIDDDEYDYGSEEPS